MAIDMKEAGKMISFTVMEHLSILMVESTLVKGFMVKEKVKVLRQILMAIVMKEVGKMITFTVMEHMNGLMVESTLVNGLMIKEKVKEL